MIVHVMTSRREMELSFEFRCILVDDTIFDNKSINYSLKHNNHIFALHCLSNNITYENMLSLYYHCGHDVHALRL
jgi:hypothetical protein